MDEQRFDWIATTLAETGSQTRTRRGVLRLFGVSAVAAVAAVAGLDAADAKKKNKKNKKRGKRKKNRKNNQPAGDQPKPIARLSVPAANTIVQTPVLESGKTYRFRASGSIAVYQPADPNTLYARVDADHIYSPTNAFPPSDGPSGFDYGVSVDGGEPDWGSYRASHVYEKTVMGEGRALDLRLWFDRDNYPNVQGAVDVEIYG